MPSTLAKPRRRQITVGPNDHGHRMSLDDFDRAVGQEGYLYELNKGVIEVSDVPHPNHLEILQEIRDELSFFRRSNPGTIHTVAGSNDAKVLLQDMQSERHPDISVYLQSPPETKDVWSIWIPSIVVEVVSKSSINRDYEDKPAEYLAFGVDEYWIVDPLKKQVTVMSRWRGSWKTAVLKSAQKLTTPLLPGFAMELKRVFG